MQILLLFVLQPNFFQHYHRLGQMSQKVLQWKICDVFTGQPFFPLLDQKFHSVTGKQQSEVIITRYFSL